MKKFIFFSLLIFFIVSNTYFFFNPFEEPKVTYIEYPLSLNLETSNSAEINQTIVLTREFTAWWKYHIIYKDYRDQDYTAEANFHLISLNDDLYINVTTNSHVDLTKVIIDNKNNNALQNHPVTPSNGIVIQNYKDWTFKFYLHYSHTYTGCAVPRPPVCEEAGPKTVEGYNYSEEFDFSPSVDTPSIYGYNLYLFVCIISLITIISLKLKGKIKKI